MSEVCETLRSKLNSARELGSVVRTMKALAAANIGQYERAVRSLTDYYRAVELALAAWSRSAELIERRIEPESKSDGATGAVVFGSDLGLVGRFNNHLANYVLQQLASAAAKNKMWVVGERMGACLADASAHPVNLYPVPNSISTITPLITQLLVHIEESRARESLKEILVFHNRPGPGAGYAPGQIRLLPLDQQTVDEWNHISWPTARPPEVLARSESTLVGLIREHLFVSLFRACAESLASENASRLAAMQRAERNIRDLVEDLTRAFNQARQTSIDEELFDLLGGFEALSGITPARQQMRTNE